MRMTKKLPDGSYELTDPDQLREAIQRLGQAEDALESLSEQYHAMEAKLEAERSRGHGTRSVTFSRMLAEKLMLNKSMGQVRAVDIANLMNFSKPSVSIALKKLRQNGYVNIDGGGYITLTESGLEIAERVFERHRLISQLLMALGVDEQTAKEDACRVEHDLSVESFEAIKEYCRKNLQIQ